MVNLVYAILLIGIVLLPIPIWSLLEYRSTRKIQRRGFEFLQEKAAQKQLELTSQSFGANEWLAADTRQRVLMLVSRDADQWHTRYLAIQPGCTCRIHRTFPAGNDQTFRPLSVSVVIEPPGEVPAEWNVYHSGTYESRKHQQAEKLADEWCVAIREMAVPL